ncbi:hypothetical protein [Eubacterium ventriosum]|jgi:hypothetical protein|uniref:hypothetical protein n=1 Tax=Eubacterium ventriosum TaxID=39496 RepID=UPI00206EE46A|nr:MAG TPA: hypothetical protein [Caudoviricetes sp.]
MNWIKGKCPNRSAVVVVKEMHGNITKLSVAVYDEYEKVFFKNGKAIKNIQAWRYK